MFFIKYNLNCCIQKLIKKTKKHLNDLKHITPDPESKTASENQSDKQGKKRTSPLTSLRG